jgi:RNA polymerase sigma-70 factor (ECF subfamily)
VRRFLYGLLGCPASADDATQETFLRAFQRLDLVREGEPLAPWLFGIARLVSLEHRRARRRAGDPMAPDAIRSASFVDAGTPESALLGHEVAGVVRRALLAMPEERRAALLLRVDHDVPYEAIARLLGWSLAKAKVEVHRARATLHATLAAHAGETP